LSIVGGWSPAGNGLATGSLSVMPTLDFPA
jgi:hypothetical protein